MMAETQKKKMQMCITVCPHSPIRGFDTDFINWVGWLRLKWMIYPLLRNITLRRMPGAAVAGEGIRNHFMMPWWSFHDDDSLLLSFHDAYPLALVFSCDDDSLSFVISWCLFIVVSHFMMPIHCHWFFHDDDSLSLVIS